VVGGDVVRDVTNAERKGWIAEQRKLQLKVLGGLAVGFVYFLLAAPTGGMILRGEMSPWFWEQYHINAARHGQADALLGVGLYLAFYAAGFVLPCAILLFGFYCWQERYLFKRYRTPIDRGLLQAAIFFASVGCLLLFVLLLDSEVAFLRAVPTEVWNGWLLILVGGGGLFSLLMGITGIGMAVSKTTIRVKPSADIFCRCPQCDHAWTFPAEDLRTHNIVRDREEDRLYRLRSTW